MLLKLFYLFAELDRVYNNKKGIIANRLCSVIFQNMLQGKDCCSNCPLSGQSQLDRRQRQYRVGVSTEALGRTKKE